MNIDHNDPTKINLHTNLRQDNDPTLLRMKGTAYHGNTKFDVPFISHIEGNLWQGGCQNGLLLPHEIKHVISLYPWETYTVTHTLNSSLSIVMYDSLEQTYEQVDHIANWVNACLDDGPTLVHCQAGLNRSSLVAARALMLRGYSADDAIGLLRSKRSQACLCNPAFEKYLKSIK